MTKISADNVMEAMVSQFFDFTVVRNLRQEKVDIYHHRTVFTIAAEDSAENSYSVKVVSDAPSAEFFALRLTEAMQTVAEYIRDTCRTDEKVAFAVAGYAAALVL